jgi:hypothetical protein
VIFKTSLLSRMVVNCFNGAPFPTLADVDAQSLEFFPFEGNTERQLRLMDKSYPQQGDRTVVMISKVIFIKEITL